MDRRTLLATTLRPLGVTTLAGRAAAGAALPIAAASGGIDGSAVAQAALQAQGTLVPIYTTDVQSVTARPEMILVSYQALAPGASPDSVMRQAMGPAFASLANAGCFASYAALLAGTVGPSGAPSLAPMSASLLQLLQLPALACGHYDKLAMLLTLLAHPGVIPPEASAGDPAKPTMHFAVWLASAPLAVGVHSQLVLTNALDSAYLLLDPMYSFAIRLPYSGGYPKATLTVQQNAAALLHTPVATGDYVDLWTGNGVASRAQVVQAMTSGALAPQYLDDDAASGSEAWDVHMAAVIDSMA